MAEWPPRTEQPPLTDGQWLAHNDVARLVADAERRGRAEAQRDRVPLRLWNEARAKADEREENISDVIREALERYVGWR